MKSFSDLQHFCQFIINKYGSPSNASEDDKAREFRNVYLHNLPMDLRTIKAIALACGIQVKGVDSRALPQNIRGYHDVFDDSTNIYYKNGDTISGIENTILHEFREIIEPVFGELCSGYNSLKSNAIHLVANKFATAVLLPKDEFKENIYGTGFVVVELSKLYSKSCAQVVLRMGEVLEGSIFLYTGLYEEGAEVGNWTLRYRAVSTNNNDPEENVYGADGLFPRKGKAVVPGSLVEKVIKEKRPYFVRRITLLESREDDGLTAIARPLFISGEPAKVALVVVLFSNLKLLQPQIDRICPSEIYKFNKHL